MCSLIRGGTRGLNFLVERVSNRREEFKPFWLVRGSSSTEFPHLVGEPNLPIKKTLSMVLGLLTVIILKRVSGSVFFPRDRFTACKVKFEKAVTNPSMVFNLLKIIHLFQGEKHLRTL